MYYEFDKNNPNIENKEKKEIDVNKLKENIEIKNKEIEKIKKLIKKAEKEMEKCDNEIRNIDNWIQKEEKKPVKKSVFSSEQFIINGTYSLIKMLGFGAFGEIHLVFDSNSKQLRAIKFEMSNHKNPQLKHEYSILEQLNNLSDIKKKKEQMIIFLII